MSFAKIRHTSPGQQPWPRKPTCVDRPSFTWGTRGDGALLKARRTLYPCTANALGHTHRECADGRNSGNNPDKLIRPESAPWRYFSPSTGRRGHYQFSAVVHIANLIRGVVGQKTPRIGESAFGGDRTGKPEAWAWVCSSRYSRSG